MEKLCDFKEKFEDIIDEVLEQDISKINAHELGEVIDCLKDIYQCEYYYKVIEAMKDNDEISTDVRNRMYYHNPEVETVEDVDMIITELFQNCTTDEKLKMKQHLLGTVNKL